MTKTRNQLVDRALKEIGIVPISTVTYASVDELVDGLFDSLNHRDVVYPTSPDSIDEELFLPIASCLAYRAAPEMGVTDPNQLVYLKAKCDAAEHEMKKISSKRYSAMTIPGTYY